MHENLREYSQLGPPNGKLSETRSQAICRSPLTDFKNKVAGKCFIFSDCKRPNPIRIDVETSPVTYFDCSGEAPFVITLYFLKFHNTSGIKDRPRTFSVRGQIKESRGMADLRFSQIRSRASPDQEEQTRAHFARLVLPRFRYIRQRSSVVLKTFDVTDSGDGEDIFVSRTERGWALVAELPSRYNVIR